MRIAMVLPTDFPPDIRVEKEIGTLLGQHQVSLLCPRRGAQPAQDEWNGVEIQRVFSPWQRRRAQWSLMTTCDSRLWETAIREFAVRTSAEALHVHDLPPLGPALRVGTDLKIPVVADLHENYPEMLGEAKRTPLSDVTSIGSLVSRLLVSVGRWRRYEKSAVPAAQRIVVVVDEARERLVKLGIPAEKTFVVGNYDSMSQETDRPVSNEPPTGKLSVIYAGGFDSTRDLATVIRAVSDLPEATRDSIRLQLCGGQRKSLETLGALAAELGVEQHVTLMNWIPREDAERLIAEADIGLVPHVKSAHTDATIPHKLFQYMWRRLPVIVSDCAPLERIVRETGCGLVYRSGDSASLASCLQQMHDRKDRTTTFGDAGHDAVAHKYNWEQAGHELLKLYGSLA